MHKIERTHGASRGGGGTHLKGFPEGKPIGAGQIIQTEELCLENEDLTSHEANLEYRKHTKFGHLIIAGTVQNLMVWKKLNANTQRGQRGRVWASIEHTAADEGGRRGYILLADAANGDEGSATVENDIGYMVFYDGEYYHGELKDGKAHGNGKCTTVIGDVYGGEWKDNKCHGKGTFTFASGEVYDGEWKDGIGFEGTHTFGNGEVYDGEFKDDIKHGKGTYTFADGDVYDGEWKDDIKHEKGKMIYDANDDWYTIVRGAWHWWQNTLSDGFNSEC